MGLERVTHIEGLNSFEDHLLADDISPSARIVKFEVKAVEKPFLSNQQGRIVYENKIHITIIKDLGNSVVGPRPIRDQVHFDEQTGKWVIDRLPSFSDIRRFPAEWNAFMRGASVETLGTPLSTLFRNDPVKVENYKIKHIHSVEHLAGLTDSDIQSLGMGVREDSHKAKMYLERISKFSSGINIEQTLQKKDQEIASLKEQLSLVMKRVSVLAENFETEPKKRGRPTKGIAQESEAVG